MRTCVTNIDRQNDNGKGGEDMLLNEAHVSARIQNASAHPVSSSAGPGPRGGCTTPTVYDDGQRAQAGQTRASARRGRHSGLLFLKPAPLPYDLARMGLALASWGWGLRLFYGASGG